MLTGAELPLMSELKAALKQGQDGKVVNLLTSFGQEISAEDIVEITTLALHHHNYNLVKYFIIKYLYYIKPIIGDILQWTLNQIDSNVASATQPILVINAIVEFARNTISDDLFTKVLSCLTAKDQPRSIHLLMVSRNLAFFTLTELNMVLDWAALHADNKLVSKLLDHYEKFDEIDRIKYPPEAHTLAIEHDHCAVLSTLLDKRMLWGKALEEVAFLKAVKEGRQEIVVQFIVWREFTLEIYEQALICAAENKHIKLALTISELKAINVDILIERLSQKTDSLKFVKGIQQTPELAEHVSRKRYNQPRSYSPEQRHRHPAVEETTTPEAQVNAALFMVEQQAPISRFCLVNGLKAAITIRTTPMEVFTTLLNAVPLLFTSNAEIRAQGDIPFTADDITILLKIAENAEVQRRTLDIIVSLVCNTDIKPTDLNDLLSELSDEESNGLDLLCKIYEKKGKYLTKGQLLEGLSWAAKKGHRNVVASILHNDLEGPLSDYELSVFGKTLYRAILKPQNTIFDMLFNHGKVPAAAIERAFLYGAQEGELAVVSNLFNRSAQCNKEEVICEALKLAAQNSCCEVIVFFLEHADGFVPLEKMNEIVATATSSTPVEKLAAALDAASLDDANQSTPMDVYENVSTFTVAFDNAVQQPLPASPPVVAKNPSVERVKAGFNSL